jgi:hypothetical protein
MTNPSWLVYSTLRMLCILHGIEVQNVSRRTLYNWKSSGVCDSVIDLIALRLRVSGHLSAYGIRDIYLSCGYSPVSFSYASYVKCRAPGLS